MNTNWIPILTSESGLSLTPLNWQEAHVHAAAYYLDFLLVKPGLQQLNDLASLANYLNWSGTLILNASRLKARKDGTITIISPYDGGKLSLDYPTLLTLINHLRPNIVILPRGIINSYPELWDDWNQDSTPYLAIEDIDVEPIPVPHGAYFEVVDGLVAATRYIDEYKHLPRYVFGVFNKADIQIASNLGVDYVESDGPAKMGMDGLVYGSDGVLDLKSKRYEFDFENISRECACTTCESNFTRAYLHHLYQHTPLLCQRFLIQHNASVFSKS